MDSHEWALIARIVEFLEPFAQTTRHIEGYKYPTLSCVIPLYNALLNKVEDVIRNRNTPDVIKTGAEHALSKLTKYYDKTTALYVVAVVIDPRHKLEYFLENGWDKGSADTEDGTPENLIETRIKPA